MHPALNILIKAARRASQIINRASLDLEHLQVTTKRQSDFVTEVDKSRRSGDHRGAARGVSGIRHSSRRVGPDRRQRRGSEYQWIIDPLDGTTNFIHGFRNTRSRLRSHTAARSPSRWSMTRCRNEMFTASKGGGAFLNERRIRVSKCLRLEDALIGTGFPYRIYDHIDAYLAIFKELARKTAGIRRPGAASLDLAYVACGRFDGFWEFGLSPWDIAGGALLISEAGGLISDLAGNENYLQTGNLVAGTPQGLRAIAAGDRQPSDAGAGSLKSDRRRELLGGPEQRRLRSDPG
jgi:myo-inositol-1(or 4)-monophosphatase